VLNETDHLVRGMAVWVRPLVYEEYAVAAVYMGTGGRPQPVHFTLKEIGLRDTGNTGGYLCLDLFDPNQGIYTYQMTEKIQLYVAPDSIIMYRCFPISFLSELRHFSLNSYEDVINSRPIL